MRIAVTGAAGAVGRRVCRLLADQPDTNVLAIDRRSIGSSYPGIDTKTIDLAKANHDAMLAGTDVVVHLASGLTPEEFSLEASEVDLGIADRLLAAAARVGVGHVVILSSAMAYGAWPDNALPLTEQALLRPNPEYLFARHRADLERRGRRWRNENSGTALTVLRPAVTVAEEKVGTLSKTLASAALIRTDEAEAPMQFLHADDLASAIALVVERRHDGALNVAPDGWISPDELRALAGPKPWIRLPEGWARLVARLRWHLGFSRTPPGIVPYTMYPWAVSNDALRSLGWIPENSNEEAYVLGHDPGPLDMIDARRRQQLALGAAGAVVAAGAIAGGVFGWRAWKRRQ